MFNRNKMIKRAALKANEDKIRLLEEEKNYLSRKIIELEKRSEEVKEEIERNRKLKLLIEINTYITNSLEKEEILKRILHQIKQLLTCESSSILFVDEELNLLKFAYLSKDEEGKRLRDTSLKMGEGIAGTVWGNGTPILINDAQNDPRFSNRADKKVNTHTNSIIAVPLTVNGIIIGVIEAINKINDSFTSFDLQMLQYISTQSAIAIKNADLYDMSNRDGMTRLFINKYFKKRLLEEWKRANRFNHDLSLVIFDIDHFKSFNDTYGHQAGDRILKEVAAIIEKNCRSIDIPCRYGGEEFSVVLPETSSREAMVFVNRIREMVEQIKIEYQDTTLELTISGGFATIPELKVSDVDELIGMADKALYYSKDNGRNRVTFYNSKLISSPSHHQK
ncbi:MAG: diguanylate cyclase [Spirochaetota bacterium]|nr:diguanylate cyclase [Spirochaetota bacterium]